MPSDKQIGNLILIGFGQHNLKDMMKWVGTEKEEKLIFAPDLWPPRYRPESSCSQEDLECFVQYVTWISNKMKEVFTGDKDASNNV